jgi:hypothetical protein
MAQDFEQLLKDVFGEPLSRLTQFQNDQVAKLVTRVQEIARDAIKDELARLYTDVADLRARVATLEAERLQRAADQV